MSSSESENTELLQSAIDHDFINAVLTKAACSRENTLPSLRHKEQNERTSNLKVTPGFQKHVAKHLDAIIQRNIKEVTSAASSASTTETAGGIRLFSQSKSLITKRDLETKVKEQIPSSKRRRKRELTNSSSGSDESADEFQRISSAAVSPEWVLQKKGAYGKNEKGKVVKLRDAGNGQLIVVSPIE